MLRACGKAAEELKAARALIEAQKNELDANRTRLAIEQERSATLQQKIVLLGEQVDSLQAALAAERDGKAVLERVAEKLREEVAKLQREKSRARRLAFGAFFGGLAAGVLAGR